MQLTSKHWLKIFASRLVNILRDTIVNIANGLNPGLYELASTKKTNELT